MASVHWLARPGRHWFGFCLKAAGFIGLTFGDKIQALVD
jgi:hypothetical protein